MGYFVNFDNEFSNKYEKNLMDMFFYLYIDGDSNLMQFHYHLILHQGPLKFYTICNGYNLTVFDGLSNDNKIV
jgi:hypothetical protein